MIGASVAPRLEKFGNSHQEGLLQTFFFFLYGHKPGINLDFRKSIAAQVCHEIFCTT
jgi:hypothetical protein